MTAVLGPSILAAALTASATVVAGVALTPKPPQPKSAEVNLKQTVPPRRAGYGRARLPGSYMLWDAKKNAWDVLAFCEGPIDAFEKYYLNDDEVTLDGTGKVQTPISGKNPARYKGHGVWIKTRKGLATETSYADGTTYNGVALSELGADVWTADHRGDGIASGLLVCTPVEKADMPAVYPNGSPNLSVVGRLALAYDWRDGTQSLATPSTWKWTRNSVVALAHYLCHAEHGPNFAWDRRIAPALADWTAAANVCDEAVTLKAGGTEPRYTLGGYYEFDEDPSDVQAQILASFDGWIAEKGDGSLTVKAGKYYAPTVTLDAALGHITGYSWRKFTPDEESVNELVVTYTSPEHGYTEQEAQAWRDEADIAARGVERPKPLPRKWVQSHGQARRLAKREMARAGAQLSGTIRANLFGLQALGERYLRIKIPEVASLSDLIVEVTGPVQIDVMSLSVTIPWVAADPDVDDWDPATEEGDAPPLPDAPDAPDTVAGALTSLVVTATSTTNAGGTHPALKIEFDKPGDVAALGVIVQYRVYGQTTAHEKRFPVAPSRDPSTISLLVSEGVLGGTTYEVRVAAEYVPFRAPVWTSWTASGGTTPSSTVTGQGGLATNNHTVSASAPGSPATGDLWTDTSAVPNKIKRWSGSAWTAISSLNTGQLADRNHAESSSAPSSPGTGDLWTDTSATPVKLKRWNGSAWVVQATYNTGALADLNTADTAQLAAFAATRWSTQVQTSGLGGAGTIFIAYQGSPASNYTQLDEFTFTVDTASVPVLIEWNGQLNWNRNAATNTILMVTIDGNPAFVAGADTNTELRKQYQGNQNALNLDVILTVLKTTLSAGSHTVKIWGKTVENPGVTLVPHLSMGAITKVIQGKR
jgi:hypothetical protein